MKKMIIFLFISWFVIVLGLSVVNFIDKRLAKRGVEKVEIGEEMTEHDILEDGGLNAVIDLIVEKKVSSMLGILESKVIGLEAEVEALKKRLPEDRPAGQE